jgi:hypothetical protein
VRAAELLRWQRTGAYDAIVAGAYQRRGADADQRLADDYVDAAGYYSGEVRQTIDKFSAVFAQARDAFRSTWKGGDNTQ